MSGYRVTCSCGFDMVLADYLDAAEIAAARQEETGHHVTMSATEPIQWAVIARAVVVLVVVFLACAVLKWFGA